MNDPAALRPTRILVGVDGSEESDAAVEHAIAVARPTAASLVLAHVLPLPGDLVEDSSYDPLFRSSAAGEIGAMHRD